MQVHPFFPHPPQASLDLARNVSLLTVCITTGILQHMHAVLCPEGS